MSLQTLQAVLQQQATADGKIAVAAATITAAALVPAAGFDEALLAYLKAAAPLRVTVTQPIPAPVDNELTLSGTASFLSVNDMIVQVTFTDTAGITDVTIIATPASNWIFATSFPILRYYPFNVLSLSQSNFIFTTAATGSFSFNSQPIALARGLNYAASLQLNGALGILQYLMSGLTSNAAMMLAGTIDTSMITQPETGSPVISLTGTINSPITANTRFNLSLPQLMIKSIITESGILSYWIMFSTTLSVDNKPFSSFQAAIINGSSVLDLDMLPTSKVITPADIVSLIGVDYREWIPESMAGVFDARYIGLSELKCSIDIQNLVIEELTGAIGTSQPWQMGQFTLEEMRLSCSTLLPFTADSSTSIVFTARAKLYETIFKGYFNFDIEYNPTDKSLSIGASYKGTVSLNDLVAGLSNNQVIIPSNFVDVQFEDFGMIFTSNSGQYNYVLFGGARSTVNITMLDRPVVATLEVLIDSAAKSYILRGGLSISRSFFSATVNLNGDNQVLSATWQAVENEYLSINDILTTLNLPAISIPPSLDLSLKAASITYNITKKTFLVTASSLNYGTAVFASVLVNNTRQAFFMVNANRTFSLSDLPLVGEKLSSIETIEVGKITVIAGSVAADAATATSINQLIQALPPNGYPLMPVNGMTSAFLLAATLNIGGTEIVLQSGSTASTRNETGLPVGDILVDRSAMIMTTSYLPAVAAADGTSWFDIQKNIGPLSFQRIGVKYEDGMLWFLLNASFTSESLSIQLTGMAIGTPLSTFTPSYSLDGLGVDFRQPGLEIAGSLAKVPAAHNVAWEYAGGMIIRVGKFSITALGSYANVYTDDSHTTTVPSMFVFGQVTGSFGGPPAFFVTGLAGGFGYNSNLRLPAMNEVYEFPLVGGAQDPAKLGGNNATPANVLKILMGTSGGTAWVTHDVGQYWFAAGIQFSSFGLVTTNALLVVLFGKQLKFALLGLSRARFPMETTTPAYAFIELQVEVIVDPEQGLFSLTSVLSPNSFLLDPTCRLSGGFAFYTWYDPSPHAGDFTIALGGYHPAFEPPDWYPQVPRVGFSWSLDNKVSITGTAYFAMTPSAIMAGGALSATYNDGDVKAWFRAWTNMLIYWNPFHFDIEIGITVGVSYKMDLGFTSTILEAELGADLRLWGPATGGRANVHWYIISFTIEFGAAETTALPPLKWPQFLKQLPGNKDDLLKIVAGEGLAANGTADMNGADPWLVRPSGFALSVTSTIPNTTLTLKSGNRTIQSSDLINIRPMQDYRHSGDANSGKNLTSKLELSLTRNGVEIDPLLSTAKWTITARRSNLPTALWGIGPQGQVPDKDHQLVKDMLVGFDIVSPQSVTGHSPGLINAAVYLKYNNLKNGQLPVQPGVPASGPAAVAGNNVIGTIHDEIATAAKTGKREALIHSLLEFGMTQLKNDTLNKYAVWSGAIFEQNPLLIPSS